MKIKQQMNDVQKIEIVDLNIQLIKEFANLACKLPSVVEFKTRVEEGDDILINEFLKLRKEWAKTKINMSANKKTKYELELHAKAFWILDYLYKRPEKLKLIIEHDIDTLPKGNSILYNSVKSQEELLSFLVEKEGIEKHKERIEIDNQFFPDENSTKSANNALNKIITENKTTIDERIFKTKLSENEREARCNEIIADNGGKIVKGIDNRLFVEAKEEHRPIIMYLLGGKYPTDIKSLQVVTITKLHALLHEITDVDGEGKDKGNKVIPGFIKRFCIEHIRDKSGNPIKNIKR